MRVAWSLPFLTVCLVALSVTSAQEEQTYSCERIDQVPAEERCSYVTTQCDTGGRIPLMPWYYCHVEPAGFFARFFYMVLLSCLLPLLFMLLGDTAELYFSPTMAVVAQSIPKMRPRFAGVTFVAMGNGAPDLSANISAIRNGSVQLSAGALTGAAMFVQCVVASEVIRISQGAPCRGATLREVATYSISLIGVALSLSSGTITRWFVAGAIMVYALYAVWVFCGDEWHARGRPSLTWLQLQDRLLQRQSSEVAAPQWASLDVVEPLINNGAEPKPTPARQVAPMLDARTYRQAVWADLSSDQTFINDIRTHRTLSHTHSDSKTEMEMGINMTPLGSPIARLDRQSGFGPGTSEVESEEEQGASLPTPTHQQQLLGTGLESSAEVAEGREGEATASEKLWQQVCFELTMGESAEWPNLPALRRRWRSVTFPLLLPVYTALRMTIPLVDPAGYSPQWLVVSLLCAPLTAVVYFGAAGSIPTVLVAMGVGAALATVVHILTRDEEVLPSLDFGTGFAFGPAVFSLMGFFMGVVWIDMLATEVVGILSLVANLASLPSSLVGLTLLAWGGSLGDLFGDVALAKNGHASTALTACFAGPLFNMLVGLALGFSSRFAREGTSSMAVELTPDVAVGCVCLLIYNVVVVAVGVMNGFKLPPRFYLFARAWYCMYLVLACGVGLAELWK